MAQASPLVTLGPMYIVNFTVDCGFL